MRNSIKDIAKAAGVSHSTVSRALSDSPLVSAQTKLRIRRLATEMGYSPDAQARSLVMGRTFTVGVVVTSVSDPFITEVVQSIESTAFKHGYSVILTASNSDPEREIAAVDMLRSKRVDGVIVTSSRVGALYLDHLERIGVPIVLLNNHSAQSGRYTFTVAVDNLHGGRLVTEHLLNLGHRRIGYVTGPAEHSPNVERMQGYRQALEAAGLRFDPNLVIPSSGRAAGGEQALSRILALDDPPSAVFCYNDMTAIGLLHAACMQGVLIPDDLAVAGFDDIPFASYVRPSLTTVAQPKSGLGRQAMEMVLNLIPTENGVAREEVQDIILQGRLIVRESTNTRR